MIAEAFSKFRLWHDFSMKFWLGLQRCWGNFFSCVLIYTLESNILLCFNTETPRKRMVQS